MPLLFHHLLQPVGELGCWAITESERELAHQLPLHAEETAQLLRILGEGRRREFLAARRLLHVMSGRAERGGLLKDKFGKPRLEDSLFHVSISHTHGRSAALAHPRPCGVDIQQIVPKISRLAHKFIRPDEARPTLPDRESLLYTHLIWSAKEALYKAYGRRELAFQDNLITEFTDPLRFDDRGGRGRGLLVKEELRLTYDIYYRMLEGGEFMLVWVVKNGGGV
ncbi:MAG: 4'-phosphopantetheinyl transferase superfamily protein [Saprospiraceae bacterium]